MTQLSSARIASLRRKVMWRLLPLVVVIYAIAILDRANVSFAKLRMASSLGFSEEVFGLGMGIFFIGYLVLEIPGALWVERGSARKCFARILVFWGVISAMTAFVHTPLQFYIARFSLGVAEAGFFPGIAVYFTHWFTNKDRTRAFSLLIMAVPLSLAFGAPVSGLLLDVKWLGLAGWQWLFICEGLPAAALGVVTLIWMTDRPSDAKWLKPEERDYIEGSLVSEALAKDARGKSTIGQALSLPNIWFLALGILVTNIGGYGLVFWLPTMLKHLSGGSENAGVYYSGLFYVCGLVGVFASGISSGQGVENKRKCLVGQIGTGALLAISAIPGQPFGLIVACLCFTAVSAFYWGAPFWTLPTLTLKASAAAVSIGFISMCANLSGYFGNHSTGWMRDHGFGDGYCLLYFATCYFFGGVLVSFVSVPRAVEREAALQAPQAT